MKKKHSEGGGETKLGFCVRGMCGGSRCERGGIEKGSS